MEEALARAAAPTRVCDLGGWTDTWFAAHGVVCHLAVWPGVEATITPGDGTPGVLVRSHATGRTWRWRRGADAHACPDPLLAAALDETAASADASVRLDIVSAIPAGASMGTSAATCVAVLAAFDALAGTLRPADAQARRAHAVETQRLGWQSGVQDQWAAASAGAHLLTIDPYPVVTCRRLVLSPDVVAHLDTCLLVVWQGQAHASSAVHDQVIAALQASGPEDARLARLRQLARDGAEALERGDLRAYGHCLSANTEAQEALHPALVSRRAAAIIGLARAAGAWGWKLNGAGGEGGTVSLLCADGAQREALASRMPQVDPACRVLPVRLAV
jgi:D-glycero-alpha-D-manno-heptose-7-phosphate kinase